MVEAESPRLSSPPSTFLLTPESRIEPTSGLFGVEVMLPGDE
jgi:hypothetical protein